MRPECRGNIASSQGSRSTSPRLPGAPSLFLTISKAERAPTYWGLGAEERLREEGVGCCVSGASELEGPWVEDGASWGVAVGRPPTACPPWGADMPQGETAPSLERPKSQGRMGGAGGGMGPSTRPGVRRCLGDWPSGSGSKRKWVLFRAPWEVAMGEGASFCDVAFF